MPGYGMMKGEGRRKDLMGRVTDEAELPSIAVPEGVELSGDSGTAEVNWRMTGDGRIEITALNGVSLNSEPEEPKETGGMEAGENEEQEMA